MTKAMQREKPTPGTKVDGKLVSKRGRVGEGAAPYYTSVADMQERIDAYFDGLEPHPLLDSYGHVLTDKDGHVAYTPQEPPTVTGLALALGFMTRLSLLSYQGKPEYTSAIVRAKARVEAYAEKRLYDKDSVHGAKFTLANNFQGWSEGGGITEIDFAGANINILVVPTVQKELLASDNTSIVK